MDYSPPAQYAPLRMKFTQLFLSHRMSALLFVRTFVNKTEPGHELAVKIQCTRAKR